MSLCTAVEKLIVEVVLHHPEVILLTHQQGAQLVNELKIVLPRDVGLMEVIGHVNPGIIRVRAMLKKDTTPQPHHWTTYNAPH